MAFPAFFEGLLVPRFVVFRVCLLLLGTNVLLQRLDWGQVSQIPTKWAKEATAANWQTLISLRLQKRCSISMLSVWIILSYHKLFIVITDLRCFFLWFSVICVNIVVHVLAKKCQHLEGSASGARIRRIGKGLDSAVHTGKNDAISPDSRAAWMSFKFLFISWNLLPRAARAIRLYKQPKAEPNLWPAFCPTELSKLKTLCFKLL